jgi:hypothetical protein
MSRSLIDKLSDELIKINFRGAFAVCGYGEPLLHKDIIYITEKLANIYDIKNPDCYIITNPDLICKYIWSNNYKPDKIQPQQIIDNKIFNLINKLINAKDKNNNYYLNSGNYNNLINKIENIGNTDTVYSKFSSEILKGAYLFNDHDFNLNLKQIKYNLHILYHIIFTEKTYKIGAENYNYITEIISSNYMFSCICNSINKLINDSAGKIINNNVPSSNIGNLNRNLNYDKHLNITTKAKEYYKKYSQKDINIDYTLNENKNVIKTNQQIVLNNFLLKKSTDTNYSFPKISLINLFDANDSLTGMFGNFITDVNNKICNELFI